MKTSKKSVAGAVGSYSSNTFFFGGKGHRGFKMTTARLFGVLVALLLLVPSGFAQIANVIGVNMTFQTSYDGTALTLAPSDVAGAVPVPNWNNYFANTAWAANDPQGGTNILKDSTGANSGISMSIGGVRNGWHNSGSTANGSSTPNTKLLHNMLIVTSGNNSTNSYTFSNLPVVGNYDVYVYLSGQDNNDRVLVQCNGTSYYQTVPGAAIANNVALLQGNNTTAGTYPNCNYVVFSGVTPTTNAVKFLVINQTGAGTQGGVAGVELVPSGTPFLAIAQQPQAVTIPSGQSLNATFTVSAVGNPAVTSYQWYQISGGATNLIAGANTSSYTANAPTASASFFAVVGNGSANVTSSVARLNVYTDGTWNTSSGSWNTPGNWVGNVTASGVAATASFINGMGGTVTLDNAAGFTVGTNIIGVFGASTVQPAWTINSGSPAGILTMALNDGAPAIVSGGTANTVVGMPVTTVYPFNPVTINAPLAGNQGLYVNGGGTLVLAGNNTLSGPTVIGSGNADTTELQIGNGGTSGAIDFTNQIYLSGYAHLIFNRSDTVTVSSVFVDQAGKAPNVIVNSGTVILSPQTSLHPWLGAIVNSGGKLVLNCPVGVNVVANSAGTVNINDGTPNSAAVGQNTGNVALGINSGGMVQLAGPGGNGVNISSDNGVLNNGLFDLGGDAVQVRFMAGAGVVTNTGGTLATLTLSGGVVTVPWNGTIADGATAQTAVTLSAGTTTFTGPNTYTGNTLLAGTLVLSNSASLASANINVRGANLILANAATITNPHATIAVGSARTLDLSGLASSFSLHAGQTLVVTNSGLVNVGVNPLIAAVGSTLVPGGNGIAGLMTIKGDLTLNGNTNVFDLSTTSSEGVGNDEIVGVTNLNLSGNITLQVNTAFNNTFNPSTTYRLIKYSGNLANTATFTVSPATLGGNAVTIDTTSQPGYVLLTTGGSSPPVLSLSATNVDAFTGYPITLSAGVSGSTPITFQWFNGATAVPGATSASYTFTPTVPGVYTYTLWATNAFSTDHKAITVTVGSPTISVQCALDTAYYGGSLYLAPTDTAGVYGVSNWNVMSITPTTATAAGITSTSLVDSNGIVTPVSFTAVNVQDGWHQNVAITAADTASARLMNTYWFANPAHTPSQTSIVFTFNNLPNDTYDVYLYMIQTAAGPAQVYDGDGTTNYVQYPNSFSSMSNFVTGINFNPTGSRPLVNYVKLRISTGGSNSISFTESGAGVPGIQIVPVVATPPTITQQPLSQRVITNSTATFTVQANGFPLGYQWYSISRTGVTNVIADATNTSYTTPPVTDSDTATGFFVVVSNAMNQVSSSTAFLTAGHIITAPGLLIDDQFNALGGGVAMLTQIYPNAPGMPAPNKTEYLTAFDSPQDLAANSTERIYGWFTPPVSGDYVFFMTSDDSGALWLSTDSDPAHSYLIAQNQSWMTRRDWTCTDSGSGEFTGGYYVSGEFRSDLFIAGGGQNAFNQFTTGWAASPNFNGADGGITLVAGTMYYLEVDHVQGGGGQNATITYKLAGNPDPAIGSPSLFTGTNVSASVPDVAVPLPTPVINTITASGSKVILNADNGLDNARVNVQTSTNLTQWSTATSGWFDLNGDFSITNAVDPQAPQTFYRLQQVVP